MTLHALFMTAFMIFKDH